MRVAIGADHAGFRLKEAIREQAAGVELVDFGTHSEDSCDYPDVAGAVATAVAQGEVDRGILVCGTGVGMSMAANKVAGVRAAACSDTYSARLTRAHNDANVLCLGARVVGPGLALDIVQLFLDTAFDGGERHERRIEKIHALEPRAARAGG
ncbi:MAG: ribose 5-phosphate isomerase B [Armatimonadetes bacterium]|nr:ribose 5-phosphate isomerase B [Armatimonadota bacterium]